MFPTLSNITFDRNFTPLRTTVDIYIQNMLVEWWCFENTFPFFHLSVNFIQDVYRTHTYTAQIHSGLCLLILRLTKLQGFEISSACCLAITPFSCSGPEWKMQPEYEGIVVVGERGRLFLQTGVKASGNVPYPLFSTRLFLSSCAGFWPTNGGCSFSF